MKRRTFIQITVGATVSSALVAATVAYCKSCGNKPPDGAHLIDTTLPLQSRERDRTVCFSCVPEAREILKYWSSPWTHMHAKVHNVKCSQCRTYPGVIHLHEREFEYRLCTRCAPEARECRRWVRDLRGYP